MPALENTSNPVEFIPRSAPVEPEPLVAMRSELTAREAVFCQWYAESRHLVTAYKAAYEVGPNVTHRTVWHMAAAILERPHVNKRIVEIQDRLAASGVMRAIEILQDLADMINTDVTEITKITLHNCRHCNGRDYLYQWRDPTEYARALDAYGAQQAKEKLDKGEKRLPVPDPSGGFGFDGNQPPNHGCPACLGRGTERTWQADTTTLSPAARKLIKNIKIDARTGQANYELYDKNECRDMANKMLGAYKTDGKGLPLTGQAPLDGISIADQADPRLAADAYIRMLSAPTGK